MTTCLVVVEMVGRAVSSSARWMLSSAWIVFLSVEAADACLFVAGAVCVERSAVDADCRLFVEASCPVPLVSIESMVRSVPARLSGSKRIGR